MAKFRIEHHKDLCIGCGACVAINPKEWVMEGDKAELIGSTKTVGQGRVLETKETDETDALFEKNRESADACPVPCIFLKKKEEKD